jgi:phenylacetate-CoA ligase
LIYQLWYALLEAGTRYLEHLAWLRSFQYASEQEIYEFQMTRLKDLLHHCYRNVPFYRRTWHKQGFDPASFKDLERLSDIPITKRSDLKASFPHGTVARNVSPIRRVRKFTSGSSGTPFEFFTDRATLGVRFLFNEWLGLRFMDTWIRMTHPQPQYRSLINEIQVSTLAVTRTSTGRIINFLRHARASGLVAFPSILNLLAEALESQDSSLESHPLPLKAIVSAGETLLPADRQRLSDTFRIAVSERYTSREIPEFAQQCHLLGEMHWNPALVVLELLREEEHVKTGESGTVVMTDLWNRVMPLIRYEVGDEAMMGHACRCKLGWKTIASVVGRTADYVITKDGGRVSATAIATRFGEKFGAQLVRFQFLETGVSAYRVKVVLAPGTTASIEPDMTAYLSRFFREVVVERGELVRHRSGKIPLLCKQ